MKSLSNSSIYKSAHLQICTSAHLFLFLLICTSAHSQTVTRQLFGSGGGNATPINASYYVNWSMGEPVVHTINNSLPQLTQGFQQPEIIIPLVDGQIDLTVVKRGRDAFLAWGDQQEGSFMYQVQWMRQGSGWQQLGETPANIFRHYDVPQTALTLYYRVTAVGQDGSIRHSNVTALSLTEENRPFIYPNPTSGSLWLSQLPANSQVQLFDMAGKSVIDQFPNSQLTQLDCSQLPAAIYLLRIQSDGKNFSFKVEVRR
jgi:hypothetical protein